MPYATQSDIVTAYGNDALLLVADRNGDGLVDGPVVDKALADASALMDSYLAARYPVPLVVVPPVLTQVAVDIALYELSGGPGMLTEERANRHKERIKWLKDLADGRATLGIETGQPTTSGQAVLTAQPRRWGRDNTGGM
ncbi:MAG: DUF1320 domain-containing protein [Deltaproteobacteria bacterium]|nr:DUF1320 domain-containing protein [Deltaproteobacteria bacterium]